jgi:hypothetical protein
MEHFRLYGLILVLLVLSSVICRAEDSICVHDIDAMYRNKTLVTADPYKVGTTGFVTYTCYGTNAKFWTIGGKIALQLQDQNDSVVLSRITNLKRVQVLYTDRTSSPDYLGVNPSMQIKVSEDGLTWADLSSSATHSKGNATISLPDPGDYYISIKNTGTGSSKPIYIRTFEYKTQHCNCYQYQP